MSYKSTFCYFTRSNIVYVGWNRKQSVKVPFGWDWLCLVTLHILRGLQYIHIVGTLACVFIDNETQESGVTKCTTGEAWSAFSWHHSSVFHCQWTHNQVFLLLSPLADLLAVRFTYLARTPLKSLICTGACVIMNASTWVALYSVCVIVQHWPIIHCPSKRVIGQTVIWQTYWQRSKHDTFGKPLRWTQRELIVKPE